MIILRQKSYSKKNKKKWTEKDYESYAESRAEDYEKDLDKNLKIHRGFIIGGNATGSGAVGGLIGLAGKKGTVKRSLGGAAIGTATGAGLTILGRKINKSKEKEEAAKKELVSEYKELRKKQIKEEVRGHVKKAKEYENRALDYKHAADPHDEVDRDKNRELMIRLTGKENIYGI